MTACAALQIAQQVVIAGSQVPTVVLLQATPQRRPAMADGIIAQPKSILMALDISKVRHDVLIPELMFLIWLNIKSL